MSLAKIILHDIDFRKNVRYNDFITIKYIHHNLRINQMIQHANCITTHRLTQLCVYLDIRITTIPHTHT